MLKLIAFVYNRVGGYPVAVDTTPVLLHALEIVKDKAHKLYAPAERLVSKYRNYLEDSSLCSILTASSDTDLLIGSLKQPVSWSRLDGIGLVPHRYFISMLIPSYQDAAKLTGRTLI